MFSILQTANLGAVFKDSAPNVPLIFVLSAGTDPAVDLYKFAEDMRFSKKLNAISLGQGQVICETIYELVIYTFVYHREAWYDALEANDIVAFW